MEQKNDTRLMQKHIMRDMSEGMLIVDFSGTIRAVNPAALAIFGCAEEDLVGLPFAACFFEYPENDEFNQTILDAVYSSGERQERIVPFKRADRTLTLHVRASFLKEEGRRRWRRAGWRRGARAPRWRSVRARTGWRRRGRGWTS